MLLFWFHLCDDWVQAMKESMARLGSWSGMVFRGEKYKKSFKKTSVRKEEEEEDGMMK